jgi:hypothetical protein
MEDNFEKLGDIVAGLVAGLKPRRAVEIVRPSSREEWLAGRMATVGASELPTLFGVNRRSTPYQLWAAKSGLYKPNFPEIDIRPDSIHLPVTERGNAVEPLAFDLLRRLRPKWEVRPNAIPGGQTFIDMEARMSSTPDAFADDRTREGWGSAQIKSMSQKVFDEDWLVEGEPRPPVSVAVQAIADATLSGCTWACAGALVAGYSFDISFYLFEIPLHTKLMAKARSLVADLWRRVAENDPPPPNFARDGEAIAAIFDEDDDSEVNLANNPRVAELIARRDPLKATESASYAAKKERDEIDAELRLALGNATRGRLADGRIIEAKVRRNPGYTVEPFQFRPIIVKTPRQRKSA